MIITQIYVLVLIIFNGTLETYIYQISLLTNAFFSCPTSALLEREIGRYILRKVKLVFFSFLVSSKISRASLVAQWLRIHLPMQGTRV